jgi:hypothetical protein
MGMTKPHDEGPELPKHLRPRPIQDNQYPSPDYYRAAELRHPLATALFAQIDAQDALLTHLTQQAMDELGWDLRQGLDNFPSRPVWRHGTLNHEDIPNTEHLMGPATFK